MWRPDEKKWVKRRTEFFEAHPKTNRWGKTKQLDYEAGADGMLEALQKSSNFREWLLFEDAEDETQKPNKG